MALYVIVLLWHPRYGWTQNVTIKDPFGGDSNGLFFFQMDRVNNYAFVLEHCRIWHTLILKDTNNTQRTKESRLNWFKNSVSHWNEEYSGGGGDGGEESRDCWGVGEDSLAMQTIVADVMALDYILIIGFNKID